MPDPFQDVDAAGPEFIKTFADSMDERQSDQTMEGIVAGYLEKLAPHAKARVIEVGAGAGAVTRRIAAALGGVKVTGYEPSSGFVSEARARAMGLGNLSFEVADGAALPCESGSCDAVILHTVLTHVTEPQPLLVEAHRVLRNGGQIVICDADFSKATFSGGPNDPLDSCAREFVDEFVTDPHVVAKLRPLLTEAGFDVTDFEIVSRVVSGPVQMLPWVQVTTERMVARRQIGQPLADALIAEHDRRAAAGTLYGYQVFATAIGSKN